MSKTNFHARNQQKTLDKQNAILQILVQEGDGLIISELAEKLGISRQLCLYHVKKMAASFQLKLELEPCIGNGGLRYRIWDEEVLARNYARRYGYLNYAEAA